MIQIEHIRKAFGTHEVLKDVSLDLALGQTHVLLGSSGSGKSTLLRILMGLITPDSGQISVSGPIGYVVQDGGLFPHLTAGNNVTLVARTRGWTSEHMTERLNVLSALTGLEQEVLSQYPRQLSGGQKQRVALMRALFLDPPVLLLDEPLGALDPIVRAALQDELKAIFNRLGKTVILVTHDIGEAAFFGHTVTLLYEGRVAQHGAFGEFVANPSSPFVAEFIRAQRPPRELQGLL